MHCTCVYFCLWMYFLFNLFVPLCIPPQPHAQPSHLGGFLKQGYPKLAGLFHGKSEKKMDDFLIPLFWETSICLSTHQAALRSWDSDFVVLRTWSLEMWYTTPKLQF